MTRVETFEFDRLIAECESLSRQIQNSSIYNHMISRELETYLSKTVDSIRFNDYEHPSTHEDNRIYMDLSSLVKIHKELKDIFDKHQIQKIQLDDLDSKIFNTFILFSSKTRKIGVMEKLASVREKLYRYTISLKSVLISLEERMIELTPQGPVLDIPDGLTSLSTKEYIEIKDFIRRHD